MVKYEKVTLWTAIETYWQNGTPNHARLSALDEIMSALDDLGDVKVLEHATEDWKLVKASTRQTKQAK